MNFVGLHVLQNSTNFKILSAALSDPTPYHIRKVEISLTNVNEAVFNVSFQLHLQGFR